MDRWLSRVPWVTQLGNGTSLSNRGRQSAECLKPRLSLLFSSQASQGGDPEPNGASRKSKKRKEKLKSKCEVLTAQEPPRIEVRTYFPAFVMRGTVLTEVWVHTGFLRENLQYFLTDHAPSAKEKGPCSFLRPCGRPAQGQPHAGARQPRVHAWAVRRQRSCAV